MWRWWVLSLLILPSVFADQSQSGLPGFCALGGESIVTVNPSTNQKQPNSDYREIECRYTNGQAARVAVCQFHHDTYTSADYPTIWESIKRGWAAEMGTWTRERRDTYWKFYEGVTIQSCGGD